MTWWRVREAGAAAIYSADDVDNDGDVVWPADARWWSLSWVLSQLLQGNDVPRTTAQDWRIRRVREGAISHLSIPLTLNGNNS